MSFGLLESQGASWTRNTCQLCDSTQLILLFLLVQRLLFLLDVLLKPLSILLYLIRPRQFDPILMHQVSTSSLILLTRHVLGRWLVLHEIIKLNIIHSHCSGLALYNRSSIVIIRTVYLFSLLHDFPELLRLKHLHEVFVTKMFVLFVFNSLEIGVLLCLVGRQQISRIENDLGSISSYLLNTGDYFFYLALDVDGFS